MVAAIKRLGYLIWSGVKVFCDHRNLAYIFSPKTCRMVTKATTQRLEHWRTFLGQYPIEVVHVISGQRNSWGEMLSRWRTLAPDALAGPVPLQSMAVFAVPKADYSLPTREIIGDRQKVLMSGEGVE